MSLVLLAESYQDADQERCCDWCGQSIHQGDKVWIVTVQESALPGVTRTLDICLECSIVGSPESFFVD